MSEKKFVRVKEDRMLFGVAGGIARYLDIDPVIVRFVFVVLALGGGHGLLIYLALALLMPEEKIVAKANQFDEEEIIIKDAS